MYYSKSGMPEENELVICTVTNVHYNSVFCKLDEYGKSGMIHISEVSPGRIRNIRDYVQEGKKVICKILKLDKEKGHIDLSLRRVTEGQRREKNAEIKQEQKAEKLLEHYAKTDAKIDAEKLYKLLAPPMLKEYEYIFQTFEDVVAGEIVLEALGVPKEHAGKLTELIKEKIPPKRVQIQGKLTLITYNENGLQLIKDALVAAENAPGSDVSYLGNATYRVVITADDYEHAEAALEQAVSGAKKIINEQGPGKAEFVREEKK
ncbi:S1 RNA-binding domain-containing protein [Candidatus Woesearchaeota archaeon]|nr:S1 RNA-binding domain-containing protein [Candidatus Woesearchaeota archaeon]